MDDFCRCQMRADETSSEPKYLFGAVFCSTSLHPPLVGYGVSRCASRFVYLIFARSFWHQTVHGACRSVAHLPAVSKSKNPYLQVDWFHACLGRVGPHVSTDPFGIKITADVLVPRLGIVFRRLLRLGSSPACWLIAYCLLSSTDLRGLVCCTRLIRNLITACSASFHLLLLEFD